MSLFSSWLTSGFWCKKKHTSLESWLLFLVWRILFATISKVFPRIWYVQTLFMWSWVTDSLAGLRGTTTSGKAVPGNNSGFCIRRFGMGLCGWTVFIHCYHSGCWIPFLVSGMLFCAYLLLHPANLILVIQITLPAWPMYRRKPLKWQKSRSSGESAKNRKKWEMIPLFRFIFKNKICSRLQATHCCVWIERSAFSVEEMRYSSPSHSVATCLLCLVFPSSHFTVSRVSQTWLDPRSACCLLVGSRPWPSDSRSLKHRHRFFHPTRLMTQKS